MRGKRITAFLTASFMAAMAVSGCSQSAGVVSSVETETAIETLPTVNAVDITDEEALLVGEEGLSGVFNPLFAQSEADRMVCDLVFDTVCSVDEMGELDDAAGHLELLQEDESTGDNADGSDFSGTGSDDAEGTGADGSTEEKSTTDYQLTLNQGMKFSDGTDVTIDDVIFTWRLMADPFYEGSYALAEVPVLGMQEYYYDTKDVDSYIKNLKNYSSKDISEEDFITYLIDTKLNGWFDGELPGDLDGKGTTWVEYLESNGYDAAGVEDNADELLKLLAKCEYEHYAFSYDPYTYYQEKVHEDLLSGGIEVSDIEGIQKIDNYSCRIQFTSVNAEALRAMTVIPILSEDYYGSGYEKGEIEKLRQLNSVPMGSGSFVFNEYSGDEVSLIASGSSRIQSSSEYVKIKNIAEEDKAQALKDGKIALASLSASSSLEDSDNLEVTPVEGSGFYYLGINTDMVNRPGIREGVMSLIDKSLLYASDDQISEILSSSQPTEGEAVVSADRISNRISLTPQTWPMTRLCAYYPGIKDLLEAREPAGSGTSDDSEGTEGAGDTEGTADTENDGTADTGTSAQNMEDIAEKDVYEYSMETARSKFGEEGYWNDGSALVKNGEQLKLNMGISEELPDRIKAIAYQLKADMEELGAIITLKEYSEADMQATIPTAAFDMWIGAFTGLADYDMEDYLCFGAENNYFHHQNGYVDTQFEEARDTEDDSYRAEVLKEIFEEVMNGAYCRPLCQEVSEVYVADISKIDLTNRMTYVNEYDSFSEIISGIGLR